MSEEHTIPLVKSQLQFCVVEDFFILFNRRWVLCQTFLTQLFNLGPYKSLISLTDEGQFTAIEQRICVIIGALIIRILWLLPSLFPLRFNLIQKSYIFIEQSEAEETDEPIHHWFAHVCLHSKIALHYCHT